jgi:hypothetical protein
MLKSTALTAPQLIFTVLIIFAATQTRANTDIETLKNHVTYLASDKLCGRLPTSKGEKRAASYIGKQFESYGLTAIPSLGSYFQRETLPINLVESKRETNVTLTSKKTVKLEKKELTFLNVQAEIEFNGELAFMTDEALFTKTDNLEGKITVVDISEAPFFDKFPDNTLYTFFKLAIAQAEKRGAEALFVLSGNTNIFGQEGTGTDHSKQRRVNTLDRLMGASTLPLAILKRETWESLNERAHESSMTIQHRSSNKVTYGQYINVVGMVKGLTDKAIVIGAHFDHLGARSKGIFSCRGIFNGADDNASGTSVMLELAKAYAQHQTPPTHTLIFAAFSAEELGLVGSKSLAQYLTNKGVKVDAMINFDMLGHPDRAVEVKGSELSPGWTRWFEQNSAPSDPTIINKAGFSPRSDHGSFIQKQIPSVIFSTWIHNRYHRTTDEIEHVNFDGMQRILKKGASFIRFVDQRDSNEYIPQLRADITEWKIGNFDVIASLYGNSLLMSKLHTFTSSGETMFEWDFGLSEPPRKTALSITQVTEHELLVKINRYQNFEVVEEQEKALSDNDKADFTLPLDNDDIKIQVATVFQ